MYCSDYFASEIAAEQSDLGFYSRTYRTDDPLNRAWICPNLTKTETYDFNSGFQMVAMVQTCTQAKLADPDFEPNLTCNDESETKTLMQSSPQAFTLRRQLTSTNFVPSTYHYS